MRIKILFDKDSNCKDLQTGWGIAYLVNDTILFDTGEKGEYLLHNMEKLKVSPKQIDTVVISHNHWDHRGGVWPLLEKNHKIKVVGCIDFVKEFSKELSPYNFIKNLNGVKLEENIFIMPPLEAVSKENKIFEQTLVVKTLNGMSLFCGCAHPGILNMVEQLIRFFPGEKIYSVWGGFHLIEAEKRVVSYIAQELKKQGVILVFPAHCTGYAACQVFKEVFKEKCFSVIVGQEYEV